MVCWDHITLNFHDISLQLMRRFTSSSFYNVNNWPVEYKDQFYPLLSKHHYQEGSLQAISLDHVLEVCKLEDVRPLPPVYEVALELHQKEVLADLVLSHVGHSEFILLILCDKATAISVQGFTLGSSRSRFVTRSHVMANHPEHASVY